METEMKIRQLPGQEGSNEVTYPQWAGGLPSAISHRRLGLYPGTVPLGKPRWYGTPGAYRGVHASTKCLGPPLFESLLERDYQTMLCCDPRVAAYAVQSHQLTYSTPGPDGMPVRRLYTPDLSVLLRSGAMLVIEVKAEAFAAMEYWQARGPYIRLAYKRDHAIEFIVVTERQIRVQPRLANFEKMLRYGARFDDQSAIMAARDAAYRLQSGTCIGQICEGAGLSGENIACGYSAIMSLALTGELELDLNVPLSLSTPVMRSADA